MDRAEDLYEAQEKGRAEGRTEGHAEGLHEGIEQGLQKGMEEGRAVGHTEGRTEGLAEGDMAAKLEIARKMKNAGRPVDEIAAFTGLPPQTVTQLG